MHPSSEQVAIVAQFLHAVKRLRKRVMWMVESRPGADAGFLLDACNGGGYISD